MEREAAPLEENADTEEVDYYTNPVSPTVCHADNPLPISPSTTRVVPKGFRLLTLSLDKITAPRVADNLKSSDSELEHDSTQDEQVLYQ